MDAPALDQAFREHEGDDLCLWLDDDESRRTMRAHRCSNLPR